MLGDIQAGQTEYAGCTESVKWLAGSYPDRILSTQEG
jgi:hypothetical protein